MWPGSENLVMADWTFWKIRFSKDGNWFKWRLGKEFWVVETFLKLFPERRSLRLKLPALSGWCSSLHQHHFQPPIFFRMSFPGFLKLHSFDKLQVWGHNCLNCLNFVSQKTKLDGNPWYWIQDFHYLQTDSNPWKLIKLLLNIEVAVWKVSPGLFQETATVTFWHF